MKTLPLLYDEYVDGECDRCPRLVESRTSVVFGEGDVDADLMIVGEGPGRIEDELCRTFVGSAGLLLDTFLTYFARPEEEWLHRMGRRLSSGYQPPGDESDDIRDALISSEKVFYANAVMCRPPENVDPTAGEINNCSERLQQMIYNIDPLLILAVGKVASRAVLGKSLAITKDRGQVFDVEIPGITGGIRYPLLVTLHPAYVARVGNYVSPTGAGQKFAQDLEKAFSLLDEARLLSRGEAIPKRRRWK